MLVESRSFFVEETEVALYEKLNVSLVILTSFIFQSTMSTFAQLLNDSKTMKYLFTLLNQWNDIITLNLFRKRYLNIISIWCQGQKALTHILMVNCMHHLSKVHVCYFTILWYCYSMFSWSCTYFNFLRLNISFIFHFNEMFIWYVGWIV